METRHDRIDVTRRWAALVRIESLHRHQAAAMDRHQTRRISVASQRPAAVAVHDRAFVDHIVGMRQFQKLCENQTRVQIYPNSINSKSIEFVSGKYQDLADSFIRIQEAQNQLVDRDSNEVVARYNHFSTKGGWLGPLIRLGSDYGCSAEYSYHPESQKLAPLRKMITSYK